MCLHVFQVLLVGPLPRAEFWNQARYQMDVGKFLFTYLGKIKNQIGVEDMISEAIVMKNLKGAVLGLLEGEIPCPKIDIF